MLFLEASDPGWSWEKFLGEKVNLRGLIPPLSPRDAGEDVGGTLRTRRRTSRGGGPRRMRVGCEGQVGVERWASHKMGLAARLRGAPGWGHGRELCL